MAIQSDYAVGSEKELLALCQHVATHQASIDMLSWEDFTLMAIANQNAWRYGYRNWQHALEELSK